MPPWSRALVALALVATPAVAKSPETQLWQRSPDRMHYAFANSVYDENTKAYTYTCRFLDPEGSTMVRLCTSNKTSITENTQVITRDNDGKLQALSVIAFLDGSTNTDKVAAVVDGVMMSYLLGKGTDGDALMQRARTGRARLLADVGKKSRVVYRYSDAVITAYIKGPELHIDVDQPPPAEIGEDLE